MKVLIVGGGGREHALLWRLRRDRPDATFYVAPGNAGTEHDAENVPIAATDVRDLAAFGEARDVDLAVVGPEAPLATGLVDLLEARDVPAFGPHAGAAEIEGSKAFAKALMQANGVPTARHATFDTFDEAEAYIRAQKAPVVVKASGLAAGKGSVVCDTTHEAVEAARAMLEQRSLGDAGTTIVVEERMQGEECSIFFLCDGRNAVPMLPSQDHKRIGEGDTGPNTGGMGAYAPISIADGALVERVLDTIVLPTLRALEKDGRLYRGCLYVGLMLTETGPRVVEFNGRFGDPEAQVVLPLLQSPLLEPLLAVARGGSVRDWTLEWAPRAAVCSVLAAEGYPGAYERGKTVRIPEELFDREDVLLFHAGTKRERDGRLVSDGGRVLNVVGIAETVAEGARLSREAAEAVGFEGKVFRRDIGRREIERRAGRA
ncbi:MAG: phosphoribosylamine--glycine ligase [Gemmatimonadota bacterium]